MAVVMSQPADLAVSGSYAILMCYFLFKIMNIYNFEEIGLRRMEPMTKTHGANV